MRDTGNVVRAGTATVVSTGAGGVDVDGEDAGVILEGGVGVKMERWRARAMARMRMKDTG
jgi:hypothetical protein